MADPANDVKSLDQRSRNVFKSIVESYLETGEPVGSRNLSRVLPMALSPASIRNVMSDLERAGLIYAPHTSAGRMPTQAGLRLFIDGLLQIGGLTGDERRHIEAQLTAKRQRSMDHMLAEAGDMISGLSLCAGVVLAERQVSQLRHIEFVALGNGRALVVLVGENGQVENRMIALPPGLPPAALMEAGNYLNARIRGQTFGQTRAQIEGELQRHKAELDELSQKVVQAGLAEWSGAIDERKSLIVRGQANLLNDVTAAADLERIRRLLDDLETKRDLMQLLSDSEKAEGVRIFIGSENRLFSLSGSSLIVSPFRDEGRQIVGVLGIIGPTRLNYARIIPMIDYTAKLIGRVLT